MSSSLTIGVTAYNAADSIERAVRSALGQSLAPGEIIVVDDASSDATPEIVRRLAAEFAQVRLVENPANSGVATSRNRIVEAAQGDVVAFFDDDDVSDPDRCARQLARILDYEARFAQGAPILCNTARTQIYPDGSRRVEHAVGEGEGRLAPHGEAMARRVLMGTPLADGNGSSATCAQMARTATYRGLGGFDPAFRRSEDTEFAVRLARAGGHFVGIGEPLVTQTMTRTSDKSLADEERWTLAVIDKHRDFFDSDDRYRFCREWIELRYDWIGRRRGRFAGRLLRLGAWHPALTWQRLSLALPNAAGNRALGRLHEEEAA